MDDIKELLLTRILRKFEFPRKKCCSLAGVLLVFDVDSGGGIVTDEKDSESGNYSGAFFQALSLRLHLIDDPLGYPLAVNNHSHFSIIL